MQLCKKEFSVFRKHTLKNLGAKDTMSNYSKWFQKKKNGIVINVVKIFEKS